MFGSTPRSRILRGGVILFLLLVLTGLVGWLTYGYRLPTRTIIDQTKVVVNAPVQSDRLLLDKASLDAEIGNTVLLAGVITNEGQIILRDTRLSLDNISLLDGLPQPGAYLIQAQINNGRRAAITRVVDSTPLLGAVHEYQLHRTFLGADVLGCLEQYRIYRQVSVEVNDSLLSSVLYRSQVSFDGRVLSDIVYDLIDQKTRQQANQTNAAAYCPDSSEPEPLDPDPAPVVETEEDLPIEWYAGTDDLVPIDALDVE